MTERLYHRDAYLREFEARLLALADDGRRLYLDRTAFYPTSGGQSHDTGRLTLGEASVGGRVIDVVDEGDRIAHVLDERDAASLRSSLPDAGASSDLAVRGSIDWPRRFEHMQRHSGQHVLSAIFHDELGLETIGVSLGESACTIDLEAPSLDRATLREVQRRANAVVLEARALHVEERDASEVGDLRKQTQRTGPLRIVSIDGIDRSACGGTHVARTSEIGPLLLRGTERVRKCTRVSFLCGQRALDQAREDFEATASLGQLFSCPAPALVDTARERLQELSERTTALRKAEESLDEYRARQLHADAPTVAGRRSVVWADRESLKDLRGLAVAYGKLDGAVLLASSRRPPAVLLATSADSGVDAGKTLKAALSAAGGRGGGSPRLAQGRLDTPEALDAALSRLSESLGLA